MPGWLHLQVSISRNDNNMTAVRVLKHDRSGKNLTAAAAAGGLCPCRRAPSVVHRSMGIPDACRRDSRAELGSCIQDGQVGAVKVNVQSSGTAGLIRAPRHGGAARSGEQLRRRQRRQASFRFGRAHRSRGHGRAARPAARRVPSVASTWTDGWDGHGRPSPRQGFRRQMRQA